jgi:hypothetical protein
MMEGAENGRKGSPELSTSDTRTVAGPDRNCADGSCVSAICEKAMSTIPDTGSKGTAHEGPLVRRCLVFLLLALAVVAGPLPAQKGKPLSVKDVMELLQGGVPCPRIAQIVAQEGISFTLFDELEKRFREAGATEDLIDALRKASKPREPQPPPVSTGTLRIQSQPGEAQVYLNDEPKGITSPEGDLRLAGLGAGTYRLRVSLAGYKTWENSIKVNPGETGTVFVTLEQKAVQPTVTLDATPASVQSGQSVTLSWAAENATEVDIEPSVGKVAAKGTTSVSPHESTTYTATAIGPGGVNTATAKVDVTAPTTVESARATRMQARGIRPEPGGLPGLPIPGAHITEVKFFESGYDAPALGHRTYQARFDHRTTRYVNWEIDTSCPALASRVDFTINATWYNPNGTVFAQQSLNTYADAGWTSPVFNFGRGWRSAGNWKRGFYRVELFVNGSRIATGSFQIY